jgi:DNA (cytosine-5)-methyltransferase 1
MKGIDLFCGAGGLSLGAKQAGISVETAIELDKSAADTYEFNFPEVNLKRKSILEMNEADFDANAKIDILMSGPPCQTFSTSNQRTRTNNNPLNDLLFEPVRISKFLNPTWVLVENVTGLEIGTRKAYLDRLAAMLEFQGYSVTVHRLTASRYGIPQDRTRLFVLGSKKPFNEAALNKWQRIDQTTVHDAIGDLPILANGANTDCLSYSARPVSRYASALRGDLAFCTGHLVSSNAQEIVERYKHISPGGNWKDIPPDLMQNYKDRTRCHTGIYHRLRWDFPSKVLGNFRKNMLVHPNQDRGISIREAARLQSFPDGFQFKGSIGKRQQQAGNAVPPQLAQAFLSAIMDQA